MKRRTFLRIVGLGATALSVDPTQLAKSNLPTHVVAFEGGIAMEKDLADAISYCMSNAITDTLDYQDIIGEDPPDGMFFNHHKVIKVYEKLREDKNGDFHRTIYGRPLRSIATANQVS